MKKLSQTVTARVCVNGKPVKTYQKSGKTYIEAKEGSEFTIKLQNTSWRKACVVVSIDGLNVIDGEPADKDSQGWIIERWGSTEIKGWQHNDNKAGGFKFEAKTGDESYAGSQGKGDCCGVIGILAHSEEVEVLGYTPPTIRPIKKGYPSRNDEFRRGIWTTTTGDTAGPELYACTDVPVKDMSQAQSIMCSTTKTPDFDMSTGWGEEKHSPVEFVEFKRGDYLGMTELFYASKQSLKDIGISFKKKRPISKKKDKGFPKAFEGFAKPPKGWTK